MEYLLGTVTEIKEEGQLYLTVEQVSGKSLPPYTSSVFVLYIPNHPFVLGDILRISVEKVDGCTDNGTETTGKLEGEVCA